MMFRGDLTAEHGRYPMAPLKTAVASRVPSCTLLPQTYPLATDLFVDLCARVLNRFRELHHFRA